MVLHDTFTRQREQQGTRGAMAWHQIYMQPMRGRKGKHSSDSHQDAADGANRIEQYRQRAAERVAAGVAPKGRHAAAGREVFRGACGCAAGECRKKARWLQRSAASGHGIMPMQHHAMPSWPAAELEPPPPQTPPPPQQGHGQVRGEGAVAGAREEAAAAAAAAVRRWPAAGLFGPDFSDFLAAMVFLGLIFQIS